MNFFTAWITRMAYRVMMRDPDFVIGPAHDPYMLRWWAIPRNKLFNIYIHKIRHDDDDRALHDHPWPSLSYMVSGRLIEHYAKVHTVTKKQIITLRTLLKGQWVYRPASFAHRLVKPEQNEDVITVFITGPRIREWGFLCPQGWRHWKDFVGKNKGEVGRGCGED